MHRPRCLRSQTSSGYITTRLHRHSATSAFSWNATKATAPGAQLLTLTSSSTLHRPRCLRSQTSSGYIATWLHRHSATSPIRLELHQGHSARSPTAHFDELIHSAQAMLPQESDQLRLHRHSATSPIRLERHQGHSARSPTAHFDKLIHSAQATLPQESDQLRLHRHSATSPFGLNTTKATALGAQLLTLMSSSTLHRPRCLRSQSSSGYIATRLHRHSA